MAEKVSHITPAYLKFEDALAYSSLSKHELRPLLQSGVVYGKKIGRVWHVSRESLDEYMNPLQTKARLVVRSVLR